MLISFVTVCINFILGKTRNFFTGSRNHSYLFRSLLRNQFCFMCSYIHIETFNIFILAILTEYLCCLKLLLLHYVSYILQRDIRKRTHVESR